MKKPLVYYALSLYFGCLEGFLIDNKALPLALIFLLMLIFILGFTLKRIYFLFCLGFYILGFLSILNYYHLNLPKGEDLTKVKFEEVDDYYSLGKYNGKLIYIEGKQDKALEGKIVYALGTYTPSKNYSKGYVATLNIVKIISAEKTIYSTFLSNKNALEEKYKTNLGLENSNIIMAVCFGDTSKLNKEDKEAYINYGVLFALSLSGYHLIIMFYLIKKYFGIIPAMVFCFIFIFLLDFQTSAFRAFIFIVIASLSKKFYKNYDSISILSLSAIILLSLWPFFSMELGFHLSFLAVLGIYLFNDKIKRFFFYLPDNLNSSIALALSTQIFTLPFLAFTLRDFSLGFLPGGIILIPFFQLLIPFTTLVSLLSFSTFLFTIGCSILNYLLMSLKGALYILSFLNMGKGYIQVEEAVFILLLLIIFILYSRGGYKKLKYAPLFLLVIFPMFNYKFITQMYYMKYGNAELIEIKYKNKNVLLIDGKIKGIDKIKYIEGVTGTKDLFPIGDNLLKININPDLTLECLQKSNSLDEPNILLRYRNINYVFAQSINNDLYSHENYNVIDLKVGYSKEITYQVVSYSTIYIAFNKVFVIKD
ncbi:MAG TPA: ComEC/Rec2 family competence protein [Clostridiaceae bacterium]